MQFLPLPIQRLLEPLKCLKKFNVKIPEDIAVVGFSNNSNSTIIEPQLTTIDQPGKSHW